MRRAGQVVAEMHENTREATRPGVTTLELDRIARDVLDRRGAKSNFLNYGTAFPAVICASPNDMIVHGIPSADVVLDEGDIISIDCGAIIEGYHGDAAYTAGVGVDLGRGREAARGHRAVALGGHRGHAGRQPAPRHRPGGPARGRGRRVLGGPGVRRPRHRHEDARGAPGPELLARATGGPKLKTGMAFAVEPMVNVGGAGTRLLDDGWSRGHRRRVASPPTSSTPSSSPTTARRSTRSRRPSARHALCLRSSSR